MRISICFIFILALAACSESGHRNGHADAQSSQPPTISGAEPLGTNYGFSFVYEADYIPPRNFESSVLNEPDEHGANNAQGRGYRVNGSGYGFKR